MNPTILGVIGPGFLNQVPTLHDCCCGLDCLEIGTIGALIIVYNYFGGFLIISIV